MATLSLRSLSPLLNPLLVPLSLEREKREKAGRRGGRGEEEGEGRRERVGRGRRHSTAVHFHDRDPKRSKITIQNEHDPRS